MMPRRTLLGLVLTFAVTGGSAAADGARAGPVVVELFTSQGCDTCPPADAVLAQLAERKDVIALSLPVTYWDMLGWRDTLASEANTRRQKAYAGAMGHGAVYTPQMIIDGTVDIVGNRAQAVDAAIAARKAVDGDSAQISIRVTQDAVHISIGSALAPLPGDATIWLFRIQDKAVVKIGAGENGGRTLTYRNVVRDVKSIGLWKGQAMSLDLPRADAAAPRHDAIAVVVQQGGYGRILGAALIGHPEYW